MTNSFTHVDAPGQMIDLHDTLTGNGHLIYSLNSGDGTEDKLMDYTKLGNTGLDVSRICLGCMGFGEAEQWIITWVLNEENSRPIIKHALDLGINFFDTANVYSLGTSEEVLGRALNDFAHRDEVVIATKVHGTMGAGPHGGRLSRKTMLSEIERSLRRLGTEYVDLYNIHRWDDHTPNLGDHGSAA